MLTFPPNTIQLIGPIWPKRKQARAAAAEVSAGHGGVSIGLMKTPEGWFTLDWTKGKRIAWVRAIEEKPDGE